MLAFRAFPAAGGEEVRVVGVDGVVTSGVFGGIRDGAVLLDHAGQIQSLPLAEAMAIEFGAPSSPATQAADTPATSRSAPATGVFHLAGTGRGRLSGSLVEERPEAIVLQSPQLGLAVVPFSALRAVEFEQGPDAQAAAELFAAAGENPLAGQDVLVVGGVDPKVLRGTLTRLGPEEAEFIFNGQARRIRTEKVYGVVLAGGAARPAAIDSVTTLRNGDAVPGRLAGADAGEVRIEAAFGQTVSVRLAVISVIELSNERVVYISDLTPAGYTSSGLIHEGWPLRTDRNVLSGPLMLGGVRHARGLGLHTRCRVEYDLGGAYDQFAATIGVDDAVRPAGSIVFQVWADDRMVLTKGPLSGRDDPLPIAAPIAGAGRLTLIVDYGDVGDLAGWADWGSARLIRSQAP